MRLLVRTHRKARKTGLSRQGESAPRDASLLSGRTDGERCDSSHTRERLLQIKSGGGKRASPACWLAAGRGVSPGANQHRRPPEGGLDLSGRPLETDVRGRFRRGWRVTSSGTGKTRLPRLHEGRTTGGGHGLTVPRREPTRRREGSGSVLRAPVRGSQEGSVTCEGQYASHLGTRASQPVTVIGNALLRSIPRGAGSGPRRHF